MTPKQEFRDLLLGGGLRTAMQPLVDLRTGEVARFEALARLESADGTTLQPDAFLPWLGADGVDLLFERVLGQVLDQLVTWDAQDFRVQVNINVNPSTLRTPQCCDLVVGALEQRGLDARRLGVELLETEVMDRDVQCVTFHRLRALGVQVTMDDFGSGHSTPERLAELPFDAVKVDRNVIAGFRTAPLPALDRVARLLELGSAAAAHVVAEGVEDLALAEAVCALGADVGQGYFFGRPMPVERVPAWLDEHEARSPWLQVTTFLGALAVHWRTARRGEPHQGALYSCPVTSFLVEQATTGSVVLDWHAGQHRENPDPLGSAKLSQWLADRAV